MKAELSHRLYILPMKTQTFFSSLKKSSDNTPPSFPVPLSLTPPKGTRRSRCNQQLIHIMPVSTLGREMCTARHVPRERGSFGPRQKLRKYTTHKLHTWRTRDGPCPGPESRPSRLARTGPRSPWPRLLPPCQTGARSQRACGVEHVGIETLAGRSPVIRDHLFPTRKSPPLRCGSRSSGPR